MRVLIINYEYPPVGGWAWVVTKNVCAGVHRLHGSIRMDLLTGENEYLDRNPPEFFERVFTVPVKRRSLHSLGVWWFATFLFHGARTLARVLRENRYDLIHYHCSIPSGLLAFLHLFSIPYVITQHGVDVPLFIRNENVVFQIVLFPLNLIVTNMARGVVCVSGRLALQQDKFLMGNRTSSVILNAVDKEFWQYRTKDRKPDGLIVLTYVWRFDKCKRIDRIIDVLRLLRDYGAPFRMNFVWSWKLLEHYKAESLRLNIAQHCEFHGPQNAEFIRDLLYETDCFLSLADYESFGLATMEAIATGTPVIVSQRAGLADFVEGNAFWSVIDFTVPETATRACRDFILRSVTNGNGNQYPEICSRIPSWSSAASSYSSLYYQYE